MDCGVRQFLDQAWLKYIKIAPDAERVLSLLSARGEQVVNDHIAFRTFNISGMDRKSIGRVFESWGYSSQEDLSFPEKKLLATYYLHSDERLPKVFVSELLLEEFSQEFQNWVLRLCESRAKKGISSAQSLLETSWEPCRYDDYRRFYPVSEYAAWTAAFGIQVNHFTVSVNSLKSFHSIQGLNDFLINHGFTLNSSGGLIKGSPGELLEQSSTMAQYIPWKFAGGDVHEIMGCYYEFAHRYRLPGSSRFFQGFIPKSANNIFESTYEKR